MANFEGKWELSESVNFQEYIVAIGVSAEMIAKAKALLDSGSKMAYEIKVAGDDWTLSFVTPEGNKDMKFKLGAEFDWVTLDGRPIKDTFTLDGDKLIEKQVGSGFESTNVRTVSGNSMTMVMTAGNGVSCTRKYTKA